MKVVNKQLAQSDDVIERQIAESAAGAFAKARKRAFERNQTVLFASEGKLIRISPSGEREIVGQVAGPGKHMALKYQKDVKIAIGWTRRRE